MEGRGFPAGLSRRCAAWRVRGGFGGILAHIDATLICEAPKIGPFREGDTRGASLKSPGIAKSDADRGEGDVRTSERLGFTGRREGIACMASATWCACRGGMQP